MAPVTPAWVERMSLRRWYAISGDHPDLELQATAPGTRYLVDNDPARDSRLNPAGTLRERLRRMLGHEPMSPWHGAAGFSAITEAWNGAAYASRYGASGSMIIFGAGTMTISVQTSMPLILLPGNGEESPMATSAEVTTNTARARATPIRCIRTARRCHRIPMTTCSTTR